jgi:GNAT superfamily N-acetyltransferase
MSDADFSIRLAESEADYAGFGRVCRLYVDWCRERYGNMPWFVEEVFGYQSLEAELEVLPVKYGPPNGRTMVVEAGGQIVAGGAFRHLSTNVCELKRLYVTDDARGHGIGRKLSNALIALARREGYGLMQLDTGDRLVEAISMYGSMGFNHIEPYQDYPATLMPYLVFMERPL